MTDGPKVTKQSVNYRPSDIPGKRCGTCSMLTLISKNRGECSLVTGVIMPGMVCDKWERKDGKQDGKG